jgi:hypothetical protein
VSPINKQLIDEMIEYTKMVQTKLYLTRAAKELEFSQLSVLIADSDMA